MVESVPYFFIHPVLPEELKDDVSFEIIEHPPERTFKRLKKHSQEIVLDQTQADQIWKGAQIIHYKKLLKKLFESIKVIPRGFVINQEELNFNLLGPRCERCGEEEYFVVINPSKRHSDVTCGYCQSTMIEPGILEELNVCNDYPLCDECAHDASLTLMVRDFQRPRRGSLLLSHEYGEPLATKTVLAYIHGDDEGLAYMFYCMYDKRLFYDSKTKEFVFLRNGVYVSQPSARIHSLVEFQLCDQLRWTINRLYNQIKKIGASLSKGHGDSSTSVKVGMIRGTINKCKVLLSDLMETDRVNHIIKLLRICLLLHCE